MVNDTFSHYIHILSKDKPIIWKLVEIVIEQQNHSQNKETIYVHNMLHIILCTYVISNNFSGEK